MVAKTFFFKDVLVNGALSLQDGGTAPTAGITKTGWQVGKSVVASMAVMVAGSEPAPASFTPVDALTPPAFSISSCWRTEQPLIGTFVNTDWTLTFRLRAATSAASQAGRIKCRIWKSTTADGSSGAVQLTSALLIGSTTSALTQSSPASSSVIWRPGVVAFNNEYLFVQCEWEVITASGNANADALFYIDSTGTVVTPDFAQVLSPALYNDAAEKFISPSPIVLANTIVPAFYGDIDSIIVLSIGTSSGIDVALCNDDDLVMDFAIATVAVLGPATFVDSDEHTGGIAHEGSIMVQPDICLDNEIIRSNNLSVGDSKFSSILIKDVDKFWTAKITGGKQTKKPRLIGSIVTPGYMVGNMTSKGRLKGSTTVKL